MTASERDRTDQGQKLMILEITGYEEEHHMVVWPCRSIR